MTKRILWVSRHPPVKKQLEELRKRFGPRVTIVNITRIIRSADEVIKLKEEMHCDEVVAVLSMWLIEELVKKGEKPIVAIMRKKRIKGKPTLVHEKFVRITDMKIVFEEL